jgi:DNA-binding MarR family transcriptional regulator
MGKACRMNLMITDIEGTASNPPLAALTRLFELSARAMHSAGHSSGLYPAQWSALRYLASAEPKERTSIAIARFQQMAAGPVTRTVRTLIQKGLVAKAGMAGHHKSERLDLTEAGLALLKRDPLNAVDQVVAALNPAQKAMLAGILGQIISCLNDEPDAAAVDFQSTFLGDADKQ